MEHSQTNDKLEPAGFVALSAGFAANFLLLSSGFFFSLSHFFFLFPLNIILLLAMAATALARLQPSLKRRLPVRLVYFGFLLFTLDVIVLLQSGVWGWKPALTAVAPGAYLAALWIRYSKFHDSPTGAKLRKIPFLGSLFFLPRRIGWDAWQCLIIPFIIIFFLSTKSDSPESPERCARISKQPGYRLVLDTRKLRGKKIRSVLFMNGGRAALLTYRQGIFTGFAEDAMMITKTPEKDGPPEKMASIEHVDFASGHVTPWLRRGEAIGITQFPTSGGDIYAVVVNKKPDPEKDISQTDLLRFNLEGQLKARISFPEGKPDSYAAVMQPLGSRMMIIVEENFHMFDPADNSLRIVKTRGEDIPPFTLFTVLRRGRFLYGVNVHSPLFLALGYQSIVKYNISSHRIAAKRGGGLFGYYDIRAVPGTNLFLLSNQWTGGGLLVDGGLRPAGPAPLPPGTRKFLFDRSGARIFAPNFFSGEFNTIDAKTGRPIGAPGFVGRGTRYMEMSSGSKILIGNSCGIVEVDTKTSPQRR